MSIRRVISVLSFLALAVGCASEAGDVIISEQLRAVPSDAFAIFSGNCGECISELDSAHLFRMVGLEGYANNDAVLAYCYTSSLSPVLVLNADVDTSVLARAGRAGIQTFETEAEDGSGLCKRVIFTISESTMAAVRRHLSMGTSILDAPGFADALGNVAPVGHWAILRNAEISKILPKNFLAGYYNRSDLVRLVRNCCDWTCFEWTGQGDCEVTAFGKETHGSISDMMASLKPASSKLPDILPATTEFAVDLPVEPKAFRQAYLNYLDANQRLSQYQKSLTSLRKKCGTDPVEWENSLDVREVALVGWSGRKVVLVRPSSLPAEEPGPNGFQGFPAALYGFLFGIGDDSFCARMEGWLVTGTEDDVRAFLDEERPETFEWPSRPLKFAVFTPEATFSWTRDNLTVEL